MERRDRLNAGLCDTCRWARIVVSGKGSSFLQCGRSYLDPRFSKYPLLPVIRCRGYEASNPVERQSP